MPSTLQIHLSEEQKQQLEEVRKSHHLPYMRERAAALLKIASGHSGREVALKLLLTERDPDTVYDWVKRYESQGLEGLFIKAGRGRKPAFFPST